MTENNKPGFLGYLLSIIISVTVTLLIVQAIVVNRDQAGCNRRQPIFREVERGFRQAGLAIKPNGPGAHLRHQLIMHANNMRPYIVTNCAKAYPPIIPFVR